MQALRLLERDLILCLTHPAEASQVYGHLSLHSWTHACLGAWNSRFEFARLSCTEPCWPRCKHDNPSNLVQTDTKTINSLGTARHRIFRKPTAAYMWYIDIYIYILWYTDILYYKFIWYDMIPSITKSGIVRLFAVVAPPVAAKARRGAELVWGSGRGEWCILCSSTQSLRHSWTHTLKDVGIIQVRKPLDANVKWGCQ